MIHDMNIWYISFYLQHVLDSTAPNLDEHRSTVLQVLKQLGVSEEKLQNMIEVWNKVLLFDLLLFSTHSRLEG